MRHAGSRALALPPSSSKSLGADASARSAFVPLDIVAVERGNCIVGSGPIDAVAKAAGRPWTAVSWLFFIESLGERRCSVISRYRAAYSGDLATRLAFGPTLLEPVGFAMDRRMLLGIKQRAERAS